MPVVELCGLHSRVGHICCWEDWGKGSNGLSDEGAHDTSVPEESRIPSKVT